VLAALGVANNALYLGLIYVGMRSISSGLSAIIVSTNPVLTALLAAVVLDEQMTWRRATGLALGVGGVAFIVERMLDGHGYCDRWDMGATSVVSSKWRDRCDR